MATALLAAGLVAGCASTPVGGPAAKTGERPVHVLGHQPRPLPPPVRATAHPRPPRHRHHGVRRFAGQPLPDPALTPGAVFRSARAGAICRAGWSERHRDVSESERHAVFAAYGIPYWKHDHYELDHLIPLELGGSNSVRNLWPERGPIPNPKDGVENQLHNLVCWGELSLRRAQRAIARNWVRAARRYGTSGFVYDKPSDGSSGSGGESSGGAQVVHPGAFCSPEGARGVTSAGTPMVCGPASDGRDRWHEP